MVLNIPGHIFYAEINNYILSGDEGLDSKEDES